MTKGRVKLKSKVKICVEKVRKCRGESDCLKSFPWPAPRTLHVHYTATLYLLHARCTYTPRPLTPAPLPLLSAPRSPHVFPTFITRLLYVCCCLLHVSCGLLHVRCASTSRPLPSAPRSLELHSAFFARLHHTRCTSPRRPWTVALFHAPCHVAFLPHVN